MPRDLAADSTVTDREQRQYMDSLHLPHPRPSVLSTGTRFEYFSSVDCSGLRCGIEIHPHKEKQALGENGGRGCRADREGYCETEEDG